MEWVTRTRSGKEVLWSAAVASAPPSRRRSQGVSFLPLSATAVPQPRLYIGFQGILHEVGFPTKPFFFSSWSVLIGRIPPH